MTVPKPRHELTFELLYLIHNTKYEREQLWVYGPRDWYTCSTEGRRDGHEGRRSYMETALGARGRRETGEYARSTEPKRYCACGPR